MRLGQGTLRSGQSLSVTERKTAQDNPTTAGHRHERTVRQSSPMRSLTLVTVPTTRRNASHMSTVLEHVRCQQRRDALAEKDERLAGGAVPTGARYLGRDVASRLGQRQSQRRTHQSCAELAVRRHDSAMSLPAPRSCATSVESCPVVPSSTPPVSSHPSMASRSSTAGSVRESWASVKAHPAVI